MILSALREKLRARGPLGFAADAGELVLACFVIGVHSLALVGAAAALGVLAAPLLAVDILTDRWRR